MKTWLWFVLCTILCWGAYIPTLHQGQSAFLPKGQGALRAFLFVGLAYFLLAGAILTYVYTRKAEPLEFPSVAVRYSFVAGILGAIGALGIVFALKNGGLPTDVVPLVFCGAPIVGSLVSMVWHRPQNPIHPMFFVGMVLAAGGAALVLRFRPS